MKRIARYILIIPAMLIMSCSADHGDSPTGFEFSAPDSVTALSITAGPNELTLEWGYKGDLAEVSEFIIYYHDELYGFDEPIDTVDTVSHHYDNLIGNWIYCFKVSAVDPDGHEGPRTRAVCEMTQD